MQEWQSLQSYADNLKKNSRFTVGSNTQDSVKCRIKYKIVLFG